MKKYTIRGLTALSATIILLLAIQTGVSLYNAHQNRAEFLTSVTTLTNQVAIYTDLACQPGGEDNYLPHAQYSLSRLDSRLTYGAAACDYNILWHRVSLHGIGVEMGMVLSYFNEIYNKPELDAADRKWLNNFSTAAEELNTALLEENRALGNKYLQECFQTFYEQVLGY